MARACDWLIVALLLWPTALRAQPLFHDEHTWTFTIYEHTYGLRQVIQTPGDFRHTQVWLGCCSFNINCRAPAVAALLFLAPALLLPQIDWGSFRCLS